MGRMTPLLILLSLPLLISAQDGNPVARSNWESAGYSCDPRICKLPDCACADILPPGGLLAVSTTSDKH